MTRCSLRLLLVPLMVIAAMFVAPVGALAQDDSSDLPVYPGPFVDTAGDTTDDTPADEVLGQSLEAPAEAEGQPLSERSIDYIGDDAATRFFAPDIQPSGTFIDDGDLFFQDGNTAAGLANTGSEVEPIIAISVGLLAVGGSALVGSRRRLRDFFR